jgi:hypothetical protein
VSFPNWYQNWDLGFNLPRPHICRYANSAFSSEKSIRQSSVEYTHDPSVQPCLTYNRQNIWLRIKCPLTPSTTLMFYLPIPILHHLYFIVELAYGDLSTLSVGESGAASFASNRMSIFAHSHRYKKKAPKEFFLMPPIPRLSSIGATHIIVSLMLLSKQGKRDRAC